MKVQDLDENTWKKVWTTAWVVAKRNSRGLDPEGVAQETVLRIYRFLKSGGEARNLQALARTTAVRVLMGEKQPLVPLEEVEATSPDPGPRVEDVVVARLDLRAALERLNPRYRRYLLLWAQGMPAMDAIFEVTGTLNRAFPSRAKEALRLAYSRPSPR